MSAKHSILAVLVACGGPSPVLPDAPPVSPDGTQNCQAMGVTGQFYRRMPNPRLVAGHPHGDGTVEVAIADPDLRWDDAAQLWQLYYHGPRATSFTAPNTQTIAHASSVDLAAWTIDDAPALAANADAAAWDHVNTETPSVVYDGTRYVMAYSGAAGALPGWTFPAYAIGIATSTDGKTFTRIPAAMSPHDKDGLSLLGSDVYPSAGGAIVADPELVLIGGTYHLWFSSFACGGTSCASVVDYGVGHATSTDGIHWSGFDAPVRSLLRASADTKTGGAQPSVIYDDVHCRLEMWLRSDGQADTDAQPIVFNNMAGVYHASSTDGMTWTVNYSGARDLVWSQTSAGEHLGLLTGADVAAKGTARYMLYGGFDDQNVPSGFVLPDRSTQGYEPGVITLNLATRDAP